MSAVRTGDRVRHRDEAVVEVAGRTAGGFLHLTSGAVVEDDGETELVCSSCPALASRFLRRDGRALCDSCSGNFALTDLLDVRPDPSAVVLCACGESLDGVQGRTWTMGDIACEYRDCPNCGSTRAYMPADKVRGRHIGLYENPDTSEVSGEWDSLLDALEHAPAKELAELRRNGRLLARAFVGPGVCGWLIARPEKED